MGGAECDLGLVEHGDIVVSASDGANTGYGSCVLERVRAEAHRLVGVESARVELGKVLYECGTVVSRGAIDDTEVLRGDVESDGGGLASSDFAQIFSRDDSTADVLVFLAKNASCNSDCFSVLLAHTSGEDNLHTHFSEGPDAASLFVELLVSVLVGIVMLEHANRLDCKVVK